MWLRQKPLTEYLASKKKGAGFKARALMIGCGRLDRHADVFHFEVVLDAVVAAFAAKA